MAEYTDKKDLIRQITCNMAEFIGTPDEVQKHDEQCNYAICMIEDAPVADVAPVVYGQWGTGRFNLETGNYEEQCTRCRNFSKEYGKPYCPNCGAKMNEGE